MSTERVTLPDLTGTTAVVTGANSGLGLQVTKTLAGRGARVVMAVRDTDRGERAAAQVPGVTEVRPLDLADLSSVRGFAADCKDDIHLLVNNAGLMMVPPSRTRDGFETQFGVNHLGHFALTNLLLPRVTGRVVTVSSEMHRTVRGIDFDDVHMTRGYSRTRAYGQSKLANLLFTLELQRRLLQAGSRVLATAAHPGYAATNLQARSGNRIADLAMRLGNAVFAQSAAAGALPIIHAATQEVPGGSFSGPKNLGGMRGAPTLCAPSSAAQDPQAARRLWELSEELTGVGFPL